MGAPESESSPTRANSRARSLDEMDYPIPIQYSAITANVYYPLVLTSTRHKDRCIYAPAAAPKYADLVALTDPICIVFSTGVRSQLSEGRAADMKNRSGATYGGRDDALVQVQSLVSRSGHYIHSAVVALWWACCLRA